MDVNKEKKKLLKKQVEEVTHVGYVVDALQNNFVNKDAFTRSVEYKELEKTVKKLLELVEKEINTY